jgi:flagellar biosynthesis/type III secretory pathway protein FliH
MQIHTLKLPRGLKNVVLIPTSTNQLTADLPTDSQPGSDQKLAATTSANSAKSPLPSSEIQSWLEKIERQIESSRKNQTATVQQFQELAIRLAVQIASTVVKYEVEQHDTRIRKIVEEFSDGHESHRPVVICVNKTDVERLRISLPDTQLSDSTIQLKEDDSIATGDCRLESSEQNVVASYERHLIDIQSELMEALENARVARGDTDAGD